MSAIIISRIFMLLVLFPSTFSNLKPVTTSTKIKSVLKDVEIGVQGILEYIPELTTDVLGNILDISSTPAVPWTPTPEQITNEGYQSETHYVTNSDGYILAVHRIPCGISGSSNGEVVYLQHGIWTSSTDWVLFGKERGLAYNLADAGYDVWMGNVRGNLYSRNHTTLNPNSKEFWDFSWHEMGMIDIPAIIDYILGYTGGDELYHVGHSQGSTTFYVMASKIPEYNDKIKAHISLAPIAFMGHLASPIVRLLALGTGPLSLALQTIGQIELLPHSGIFYEIYKALCSAGMGKVYCKSFFFGLFGFSPGQLEVSSMPRIVAHYPAGSSSKQLTHYIQEVSSGNFEEYDYGLENFKKYGSISPPHYNLSEISAPVHLIYASNDWLAATVDIEKLVNRLPNVKECHNIPLKTFNHIDFLFANNAREFVNDKVLQILSTYD